MAHEHSHSHAPANYGRAFAIGVVLNLGFVIAEFFYGQASHSLALVADAGHNLGDVLSLLLAWGRCFFRGGCRASGVHTVFAARLSLLRLSTQWYCW